MEERESHAVPKCESRKMEEGMGTKSGDSDFHMLLEREEKTGRFLTFFEGTRRSAKR